MKELTGNHEGLLTSRHSGQTIVVFALVLIVIVGCLGLAVDIGRLYMIQEGLTMKADAASLAGAQDLPSATNAKSGATNCYNSQVTGGSVTTVTPGTAPCDGVNTGNANTTFYSVDGDCVAVTTPFSDAYTQSKGYASTALIKVRAYSSFRYMIASLFGFGTRKVYANGVSLQKSTTGVVVVLNLTAPNALRVGNFTQVNLTGGGVHVDSNKTNSINTNSGSSLTASWIKTAGTTSGTGTLTPTPQTGQPTIPDPFASLAVPSTSGLTVRGAVTVNSGTTTINPGRYTGNITVNGGTLVMNPGTYYMDNTSLTCALGATISGSGVFIYLNNTSSHASISGTMNLTAQTSGTYKDILFFQDRTNTNAMQFFGTSLSGANSGALYAKKGLIDFNVTASGSFTDTQIVADTIDFDGPITMAISGKDIAGTGGGGRQAALIE